MYHWIAEMRTANVPVSAALIREKAKMIASRLVAEYQNADADDKQKLHFDSLQNFEASSGWYCKFVDRFHLVSGKLSGESQGLDFTLSVDFIHNTLVLFLRILTGCRGGRVSRYEGGRTRQS